MYIHLHISYTHIHNTYGVDITHVTSGLYSNLATGRQQLRPPNPAHIPSGSGAYTKWFRRIYQAVPPHIPGGEPVNHAADIMSLSFACPVSSSLGTIRYHCQSSRDLRNHNHKLACTAPVHRTAAPVEIFDVHAKKSTEEKQSQGR